MLPKPMAAIKNTVGDEVVDTEQKQRVRDELCILYGTAPTHTVVTLAKRADFVIEIGCRCGGLRVSPYGSFKEVHLLSDFCMTRLASGYTHIPELGESEGWFFSGV